MTINDRDPAFIVYLVLIANGEPFPISSQQCCIGI